MYRVRVWCNTCSDDSCGCFGGGDDFLWDDNDETLLFETKSEAEKAKNEYELDNPVHSAQVEEIK